MLSYAQYNWVFFCHIFCHIITTYSLLMLLMSHNYRAAIIVLSQLSAAPRAYIWKYLGISNSTRKVYTMGIHKYTVFCFEINQPLIPVCEDTQMLFVTCLAQHNLSYATMQVYFSAVRYSGIIFAKTTTLQTPRLNYILKGICKESAVNHQPRD